MEQQQQQQQFANEQQYQLQQPQLLSNPRLDPEVQYRLNSWEKDTKSKLQLWSTHRELKDKYTRLEADHRLHPHFEAEAKFKWQWPKSYLSVARPLDEEPPAEDEIDDGDQHMYDLEEEWGSMRKRHANECMQVMKQHQDRCATYLERESKEENIVNV